MQNSRNTQVPYVTLAQSRQAPGCFVPVRVDARGVQSLPVAHRGASTIKAMAAICEAYGWKYNLPVLFSRHLATLPIPAEIERQIQALVAAEIAEVFNG